MAAFRTVTARFDAFGTVCHRVLAIAAPDVRADRIAHRPAAARFLFHVRVAASAGAGEHPSDVSAYSAPGGAELAAVRAAMPHCSSSRSRRDSVLSMMSGIGRPAGEKRRGSFCSLLRPGRRRRHSGYAPKSGYPGARKVLCILAAGGGDT